MSKAWMLAACAVCVAALRIGKGLILCLVALQVVLLAGNPAEIDGFAPAPLLGRADSAANLTTLERDIRDPVDPQNAGWLARAWTNVELANPLEEIRPIQTSREVAEILLGPVREANKLLPERLDPFANTKSELDASLTMAERRERLRKQRELLGDLRFGTLDPPNSKLDSLDDSPRWKWQVQAGGSFRQGNSYNTNVNGLFQAERRTLTSTLYSQLGFVSNDNGGTNTNNRIDGMLLVDRNLRGNWICYAREELEHDEVRLIEIRNVASTGIGFRFIDRVDSRLIARTGPTVSYVLYASAADNNLPVRGGWLLESDYRKVLWESVRMEWRTTAFPDFDNQQQFRFRNTAALIFPIGKRQNWNWKIGVTQEYQVDPVSNTRANDVEGFFSILYSN